jgi:hypothetical protein
MSESTEMGSVSFGSIESADGFTPTIEVKAFGTTITFVAEGSFPNEEVCSTFMEDLYKLLTSKEEHLNVEHFNG